MKDTTFTKFVCKYASVIVRVLIVAFAIWGVADTLAREAAGYMSANSLYYYTVQSNIAVGVWAAVLLVFDILALAGKPFALPKWVYTVKLSLTVAITVTFLVFWCILLPQMWGNMGSFSLTSASNLMCHTFVPLLVLLDWFAFDGRQQRGKRDFLWGLAMPLYYLVFAMLMSLRPGIDYGGGMKVPYFFLDYVANGWFSMGGGRLGIVWWIILVLLLVVILSALITWLKNKIPTSRENPDAPLE